MKRYIQITAGRGPVECARAVTLVARELLKAIPSLSIAGSEPHNLHPDCYMSLTLVTEEPLPASLSSEWEGTVQWHSTRDPYRPGHKRSNWFVGVHFFDELELPPINASDIVYETCRSGGKGGQNVNKVETSVRAVHLPSGIAVRCSDERSQSQNKALARQRLLLKLRDLRASTQVDARAGQWSHHCALERGNPVKRFSGPL